MIAYIYIITNPINNKSYVGQSWNIQKRLREHKSTYSKCTLLSNAIKKYTWETFKLDIFEFYDITQEELDLLEILYIKQCNTIHPNGYNLKGGGSGGKHNEYTKQKQSQMMKLKFATGELVVNRQPSSNIKQSNTMRALYAAGTLVSHRRGVKLSSDQIEKQRASLKHRYNTGLIPSRLGARNSEETRKKASERLKGKVAYNKGIAMSEEQKLKISITRNFRISTGQITFEGRTISEETKLKISNTRKRRKDIPHNKGKKRIFNIELNKYEYIEVI